MSTEPNSPFVDDPLSAVDARILGSLVEKQATTPETYPLTLNALVLACNQKTSRDPVMNLTPGQVGQSLRQLEGRGLVRLVMGSRADRWEHTLGKGLELVAPQVALLGLLFLRGPQTLSELLTRSNRLHDFDDVEQIRHHLERLAGRGLAVHLERRAGQREERYMHLGCGGNQALAAKQLEEGPVAQTQYLVPMTIGFQHFCVVTQLQVGGVVYDSHASS